MTRRIQRRPRLLIPAQVWDLAADIFSIYHDYCRHLLAAVLCDVGTGVRRARERGVSASSFIDHDLRIIWCACDILTDARKPHRAVRYAKLELRRVGMYGTRREWDDRRLNAFADSFCAFPNAMQAGAIDEFARMVTCCLSALIRADRRQRETYREMLTIAKPAGVGRAA